jgi:hypothetical protein
VGSKRRRWRALVRGASILLASLLGLALIEGVASLLVVARLAATGSVRPDAERAHTRYDAELGWVSLPSRHLPDFYGPGRALTTNARGFRGTEEVEDAVTPGRRRLVCSGDSYTLGFGVGDGETWCHLLATLDPARETVNMGQGGYGIDQAWLWYRRDASSLEHQVHLFAFIADDVWRMRTDEFDGYGKPVLRLERGTLQVDNVPVPRRGYYVPWLTQNIHLLRQLRSFALLSEAYLRLTRSEGDLDAPGSPLPLALAVFEDLRRLNHAKDSRLVLVLLPSSVDDCRSPSVLELGAALQRETAARGLAYVDLVGEMCPLPGEITDLYFLPDVEGPVPEIGGHLSPEGNRFVADRLDAWLRRPSGP